MQSKMKWIRRPFLLIGLAAFGAGALGGIASASGSAAYSHTACSAPSQAAYGDNYYTTSNYYWWNTNTAECSYSNP